MNEREYQQALDTLGREPTVTKLGLFSVMWSEHSKGDSMRLKNVCLSVMALFAAILSLPGTAQKKMPDRSIGYSRVAFPRDASVLDARRDLGAKGDGIADDTEALQKGLDASCGLGDAKTTKVLYLPNGVYRITHTLVVHSPIGPWVYGESRNGVILRLADGAKDCRAVIRTHPRESGPTSADWFMRNFRNFTVDAGRNPETDGIRWCATNSGILQNLRIIGQGKNGVNAGFIDQSSPNLIQDVEIDGFETGVLTQWNWGQTLSRLTLRNCRKQGVYVNATSVAIEDLAVDGTPLALFCDYPNDWKWWGGVVALVGGRFTGGSPTGPAIRCRNVLYARNIQTEGFASALQSETKGGNVAGPNIGEYVSDEPKRLFDAPSRIEPLPIRREPQLAWDTNPAHWVCANDYGATAGDNKDDTAAFQKAIDAAGRTGKTTVYVRGIGGPDPNWYTLDGEARVHGSVRHILALGFGRIVGGAKGRFVVTEESAPTVKFQHLDSFGGSPITLENRATRRTMVVESCGVHILGTGQGDIFATDCPCRVNLSSPGQKLWARHLNPEGDSDTGLVQNLGSLAWILGMKCEGKGVRASVSAGGSMEILGVFQYGSSADPKDKRPLFDVVDARFRLMGLRELVFNGNTAPIKVREKRGAETRTLGSDREPGWIGWALYNGWPPIASLPVTSK